MNQHKQIHFEVSERKVLLRLFDVIVVLLFLHFLGDFLDFKYFTISPKNFYWTLVLSFYILFFGTVFEMYNLQVASNQFQVTKSIVLTTSLTVLVYLLTPILTPVPVPRPIADASVVTAIAVVIASASATCLKFFIKVGLNVVINTPNCYASVLPP